MTKKTGREATSRTRAQFVGKSQGSDESFQHRGGHISAAGEVRLPKVTPGSVGQGAKPSAPQAKPTGSPPPDSDRK
ncbi:hypothetical protein Aglo03_63950 [Actinokineospora globicatena]|uniref:Uncharacterized protein n=1 Tax=Actinokineospora globicatena TaxID=103729 RepID=A0A9W6QVW8_9PSEU|nr:hypothetical protein Aglo03_63950 [Actinokineospora globicatena]